jgi:hypothetical protein
MSNSNAIILVTANGMGKGPQDMQLTLISIYFELLNKYEELPAAICFYTEGVKLVTEGSPVLGQLNALEGHGVRLII